MKLIDLMVSHVVVWPAGYNYAAQDAATCKLFVYQSKPSAPMSSRWFARTGSAMCIGVIPKLAEDWDTTVVTKAQYDTAVRLANKAKAAALATPPEHPDVAAFKKWYVDTLPVVEAMAAGKVVEWYSEITGTWNTKSFDDDTFYSHAKYRIKPEPPKTININGYEVPEPLRVAPDKGTYVYIAGIYTLLAEHCFKWDDGTLAMCALKAGMLHLTREAAEVHTEALRSFTQAED